MGNSISDKEMEALLNRFMNSFVENRDPRIDLEINALKQLKGPYLEKARITILERLKKAPSSDAMSCARAIDLVEAVPFLERWLGEARSNPTSSHAHPHTRGLLAYYLYEFTKDESCIPDVIELVKSEGYGEFTSGIFCLSRMPLTQEGMAAVWTKYKTGKMIKEPHSWRENCAWFLKEKIKEPVGQRFLNGLPAEEQKELLEFIGESAHQHLERKFRLEKYVYGRERYAREDVNRFDEYIKVGGSPVKGMLLKYLWKGHLGDIYSLTWSPDGQYLASIPSSGLTADAIRLWHLESGQYVKTLEPVRADRYDRYDPKWIAWVDNRQLAVAYDYSALGKRGNRVCIWNIETEKLGSPVFEAEEKTYISNLLSFPDKTYLLLNVSNGLFLINIVTGEKQRILAEYSGQFKAMAISPNGQVVAIGYFELTDPKTGGQRRPGFYGEGVAHEVLFYDVHNRKVIRRFDSGHAQGINQLCWMPGRPVIGIASSDNTVSIWDLKKKKRIALLESTGFVGSVTGLSFSADGALLASKSQEDKLIRIWRTDKWDEVMAFRELSSYASFSFHPFEPILVSVCSLREANDNSSGDVPVAIRVWEFDQGPFLSNPPFLEEFNQRETEIRTRLLGEEITEDLEYIRVGGSPAKGVRLHQLLKGHTDRIQEINWSPDGRYLVSTSNDKTVRIWDEETGACISTFEEQDEMRHATWSPNGRDLVYGGNKQIKLWNVKSPQPVVLLENNLLRLDSLLFSPDGNTLALAYGYNTIQLFETSSWREINKKVFDGRSNCRINLQWSDDSSQLVANPHVGFIHILDAQSLKPVKVIAIPGERNEMYGFSFIYAKTGNKIAVTEEKRPISIFDLLSGQLEKEFTESSSFTSGLIFSPDGKMLVSWCQDSSVYLWRVDTGEKMARIHEYSLRVMEPIYPCFHPTRPRLVTFCDKRRSMRVWDIDYGELLE